MVATQNLGGTVGRGFLRRNAVAVSERTQHWIGNKLRSPSVPQATLPGATLVPVPKQDLERPWMTTLEVRRALADVMHAGEERNQPPCIRRPQAQTGRDSSPLVQRQKLVPQHHGRRRRIHQ